MQQEELHLQEKIKRLNDERQEFIRFRTDFLNHAGSTQEVDDPIHVSQF
jgi:hypothetical protein